ncbi:transposable element Tcb1 transposase [Trichonephila clavipes]|nr:transposable element Tcb1 transposase [Trichonephila clavipes]
MSHSSCHIDLLKDTFGDRLISRFAPVNWPPRSCDLTPLDYFLWGYVKSLVYADKPQTLDLKTTFAVLLPIYGHKCWKKSSKIGLHPSQPYTTSGCFYPRSNHWEKLRKAACDKCGCRVRIAHSIVSTLWRQFQTTGTAIRGSVVVVHEEPHPQMTGTLSYRPEETGRQTAGEIARHTTQATGRPISRFARGQKTARWWSVCNDALYGVPFNACPSEKGRSLWCREHRNRRDNEWGRVLFYR